MKFKLFKGQNEKGATLIESTIAIPFVIIVTLSCLDFGHVFKKWNTLSRAIRQGGQTSTQMLANTDLRDCSQYSRTVKGALENYVTRSTPELGSQFKDIDFRVDQVSPIVESGTSQEVVEIKASIDLFKFLLFIKDFFPDNAISKNELFRLRYTGKFKVEGQQLDCLNGTTAP